MIEKLNKKTHKRFLIFLIIISSSLFGYSQNLKVSGIVLDSLTKEPLAFVNIVYNSQNQGTTTNIDGKFKIYSNNDIEFLKFSYIGYYSKDILVKNIKKNEPILILLKKKTFNISEITVFPGINPAHRIIKQVAGNRNVNNPEKMRSFSYTSYNKLYFTADLKNLKTRIDTIILPDTIAVKYKKDTITEINNESFVVDLMNTQHLFIMESISERKFIYPDKNDENVIATKVSGLKEPSFMMLATQLQSFSFYNELINIADKYYLNPVSNGSTKKYFFLIEDTIFTEQNDTVFIISYRPSKGKNFDGLKGILHINTNNYAIQSVIAEPYDKSDVLQVKIQQKYEFIENKQWFPVQLNTNIVFPTFLMSESRDTVMINDTLATRKIDNFLLLGVGESYLEKISVNPELNKKEFSNIELKINDDAHKKDNEFWNNYRYDSLSVIDEKTYHIIDSIGKAEKLDAKLRLFETIASGYIPWKFLNFDYTKLLSFNEFEGFRPGVGIMTNERISKWYSIGGYIAYGFKDKTVKYGGDLFLNIYDKQEIQLKLQYFNDVTESASYTFIDDKDVSSSELYRDILIKNMDIIEGYKATISLRFLKYLKLNAIFKTSSKTVSNNYLYYELNTQYEVPENFTFSTFNYTEIGIKLKYAYKEKFMKTPRGYKISMGTKYPIFWGNILKGINLFNGNLEYIKLETKVSKTFIIKNFGKTNIQIVGAYTDRALPYPFIYNGHGSFKPFTVESANSFATMRLNEFISDRFGYLYLSHDFGSLLFKTKKFHPKLIICNNVGYGTLSNAYEHFNVAFKTMDKVYFESGILFNNLIKQMFIGYGIGVFYRYGYYSLPDTKDNFALKLTLYLDI